MKKFFTLLIFCVSLFTGAPALADFSEGYKAYKEGNYYGALYELRPLAKQGDSGAQFILGVMHENGLGVLQDYREAVKWYKRAAEQRSTEAQNNLARMYSDGHGVEQNYSEAVKWYRKAAEYAHVEAQVNLGIAYYKGEGVPQDYIQAHMWFNLAALNGAENGSDRIDFVEKEMNSEQIQKAQDLARECLEKDYYKGCEIP